MQSQLKTRILLLKGSLETINSMDLEELFGMMALLFKDNLRTVRSKKYTKTMINESKYIYRKYNQITNLNIIKYLIK